MYFKTTTGLSVLIIVLSNFVQTNQAVSLPDHVKAQARKLHNRCVKQSGVDEALIAQAAAGDMPITQNFKCFLHCLFDIVGLIDANNVIHLEYLVEIVPEQLRDKVINLANTCGTKEGTDACDTAYQTTTCYIETDPVFIKSVVNILGP